MFDLKFIRENIVKIKQAIVKRQLKIDLENFESLDTERRLIIPKLEKLRSYRNKISNQIAKIKNNSKESNLIFTKMKEIGKNINILEQQLVTIQDKLRELILTIPNLPHSSVPIGVGENDNLVLSFWGKPHDFNFKPLTHLVIGKALDIINFDAAARMAGSRFVVLKGAAARLERALINFMIDVHTSEYSYTEILPPYIVNSRAMIGTGQLPNFSLDLFRLENTDYWLIPTAEVPLTNLHLDEILLQEKLPLLYVAYSPCFRAEAGSYGKNSRGLIRQHQFNKVELVRIVKPEDSYIHLDMLTANAESILKRLELPYRKVLLCTGDLGFSSAKTYDLEVWLPGQNCYCEISSCSNYEDFQTRRIGLRFKDKGSSTLAHTINGSGLAIGRTLVAILENYQQEDGSVVIPQLLRPYMGGEERIFAIS